MHIEGSGEDLLDNTTVVRVHVGGRGLIASQEAIELAGSDSGFYNSSLPTGINQGSHESYLNPSQGQHPVTSQEALPLEDSITSHSPHQGPSFQHMDPWWTNLTQTITCG
jgi:hypothetical protein